MRLVDTSAWIEWLVDTPLGGTIAGELPARETVPGEAATDALAYQPKQP